ncbi:MAG: hypothetical protein P4L68_08285 [Methylovirgula sp.]|nr:hypothetical protein [Methylovirgula sp.]
MLHKFSPSTGCFYPADIEYPVGTIPDDAIDATDAEMSAAHARGVRDALVIVDGKVTVVPYAGPTLAEVKETQILTLRKAYQAALSAPVSFCTAAGVTAQFAQDAQAKANLGIMIGEGSDKWSADIWPDANGNPITPFTYADLQGLNTAINAADSPTYHDFLLKIAAIGSAKTIAAVEAVTF